MLKDDQDAYGYEIYDHFKGEEVVEVVEREDGFIGVSSGPSVYFQTYEEFPDHYKKALKKVQGRVLDIGCGAGRISLHLQALGYSVLGIDISPKAIEVCKLRGLENAKILSERLSFSELYIFENAGHGVVIQEKESWTNKVLNFLRKN